MCEKCGHYVINVLVQQMIRMSNDFSTTKFITSKLTIKRYSYMKSFHWTGCPIQRSEIQLWMNILNKYEAPLRVVRVPPIRFTPNVRATSQHTFECCCGVVQTFSVEVIRCSPHRYYSNLERYQNETRKSYWCTPESLGAGVMCAGPIWDVI